MAFEVSEYLYFTGVVLIAALLSIIANSVLISLGLLVFIISTYTLLLRKRADYEQARLARILGSMLMILLSAFAGSSALALLCVIWAMGILIITVSEHISHRGYVPIERA